MSSCTEPHGLGLVDGTLEFSGWKVLDGHEVRLELNGATGRADYVLSGQGGRGGGEAEGGNERMKKKAADTGGAASRGARSESRAAPALL
jgi:hypothetical protein